MMKSRLLALVLAGAMTLSTLPMAAMAADNDQQETTSIVSYVSGEWEENKPGTVHVESTDNGQDSKTITNIMAMGGDTTVIVDSGSVVKLNSQNEQTLVVATDGAEIVIDNGGVDASCSHYLDRAVEACGTDANGKASSVTVKQDVVGADYNPNGNQTAVLSRYGAEVTVGGNVSGALQAVSVLGGNADIVGNVQDTLKAVDNISGNVHIGGNASALAMGVQNVGGTTRIDGDLNVGISESEGQKFFAVQEAIAWGAVPNDSAAIEAGDNYDEGDSARVVVAGSVNVKDSGLNGKNTVTAHNAANIKIGKDVNTDRERAITAEGTSIVEVCGNVNRDVMAAKDDNVTIIIGGELEGKLCFPVAEPVPAVVEAPFDYYNVNENPMGNDDTTYTEPSYTEPSYTEPYTEPVSDEQPAQEGQPTMAAPESCGIISHPASEDRWPAEGATFVLYKADANNMFDLNTGLEEDFIARTYYIITEAETNQCGLSYAEVTTFAGAADEIEVEGTKKDMTNEYRAVREGESFIVSVDVPKGYKLKSFSAGDTDGIAFVVNPDGTFTVTAARGGGITLEALLQKIAKNIKLEKDHSSAPGIRVMVLDPQVAAGMAKLLAKITCSNMEYARKQFAESNFYLDGELSDSSYFTVTVNDDGELEIDIAPELLATIAAGEHFVNMVMSNGTQVQFSFSAI